MELSLVGEHEWDHLLLWHPSFPRGLPWEDAAHQVTNLILASMWHVILYPASSFYQVFFIFNFK